MFSTFAGVDEEFLLAADRAGVDPSIFEGPDAPESASAYNVSAAWHGAVESEALVFASFHTARLIAEEMVHEEQDPDLVVTVTHCYVGPDTVEASGYGPYATVTYDEEHGAVVVS